MNPGSKALILSLLAFGLASCESTKGNGVVPLYDGGKNPVIVAIAPRSVMDARKPGEVVELDKKSNWSKTGKLALDVVLRILLFSIDTRENNLATGLQGK